MDDASNDSGSTSTGECRGGEYPNIIFVMADDLGIGDLGVYDQTKYQTPHIDALARGGLTFTQHYAGSTVSAPSRGCLMTGKHTGVSHIRGNRDTHNADGHIYDYPLLDSEVTLAEMLRSAGYSTACIGKWGLEVLAPRDTLIIKDLTTSMATLVSSMLTVIDHHFCTKMSGSSSWTGRLLLRNY